MPPRDFPPGIFWQLIMKNVARKKVKNGNVEENNEQLKKEENEEKWKMKKGKEENNKLN